MCDEALAASIDDSILIIISKYMKMGKRMVIKIKDVDQDASLSMRVGVWVSGWFVVSSINPRN